MFGAKRATDAADQVHLHHLLELSMFHPRHNLNAVYRTKNDARLTASAARLDDDGKLGGIFLAGWFLNSRRRDLLGFLIGRVACVIEFIDHTNSL